MPGCKDNNQSNRDLWRKGAQQDDPFCRHRLQAPGSHISAVRTEQALLAFRLLPPPPKKLTKKKDQEEIVLDLGQEEQAGQDTRTYPALMIHHLKCCPVS